MISRTCILTILLSILFLCGPLSTQANKYSGVEITYKCLGPCSYEIWHNAYYDCSGVSTPVPPSVPVAPTISFTGLPAGCTALPTPIGPWVLDHYTELTPVCPGFATTCTNAGSPTKGYREAAFYRQYNKCTTGIPCTKMNISWVDCCRTWGLSSGAANQGIYTGNTLIDFSLVPCNSSAVFLNSPVINFCIANKYTYFHGAFDPDGDSLSYFLSPCQTNGSSQVTYNSGYSPNQPLGPDYQVNIHHKKGDITFIPNPGATPASGVICVTIQQWRNGVMVGTNFRDIQVNAIACGSINTAPTIDSIHSFVNAVQTGPRTFQACTRDTCSITFDLVDPNMGDTIFYSLIGPSSHFSPYISSSGVTPVQSRLLFYPRFNGIYKVLINARDNNCPLHNVMCDTLYFQVDCPTISGLASPTPCLSPNGSVDITLSGGLPPFTFLWNNGSTQEDLTGVLPGKYVVLATDSLGYTVTDSFYVNGINLLIDTVITQPECHGVPGNIQTSITGGTAPYTYLWNTGATSSNLTGLSSGGYSLTVTGANGCTRHTAMILQKPDSCFNIITGNIYTDLNLNCIRDAGETNPPYVFIDITPGGATSTDRFGNYYIRVDTGTTTLSIHPLPYRYPSCPTSGIASVSFVGIGQSAIRNFALNNISAQDLRVSLGSSWARPGRILTSHVSAFNIGTIAGSTTLTYTHDPGFDLISMTPTPTNYNPTTTTATWTLPNLLPLQQFDAHVRLWVDTLAVMGTPWNEFAQVTPIIGDFTPSDNIINNSDTIRASYDPNDKQVSPKGIRTPGYILSSENEMFYTVRFQNVGTDTAFYVVIRDTIDSDLEVTSFLPGTESFPYSLFVEKDSILVFTFAHIQLPDSGTDLLASQGHVSFYLKHKSQLPAGTIIKNSAAIYFDFNAPVITNTVANTIYSQPSVSVGNDTAMCEGQFLEGKIIDAGMPPYDFVWSTGVMDSSNFAGVSQAAVTTSGVYSVSVTDAFGFTSNAMTNVTAAPLPDASFTFSQSNRTLALFLSSNDNTSWSWDFGDGNSATGSQIISHTYTSNGSYTVTVIASNDCGSDTSSQGVSFLTDLDENEFSQSVTIQPNPFSTSAFVNFDNAQHQVISLHLYDLQGRQVRVYETTDERVEILRENLPQGIYLLEVRGEVVEYVRVLVE